MARIHGKKGQVKMDPTGGATAVAVANLNEWTLDMKKDRVDVTAFGDLNKQSVLGLADISGTLGGWYDVTAPEFIQAFMSDIAVLLELLPHSAELAMWTGLAYLDGGVKVSATGAVSLAGTFVGAGDWTFDDGTP